MNSRIFITIVLSYIIGSIHAYDPDALQDLCFVRMTESTRNKLNGSPCKETSNITSSDFFFAGISKPAGLCIFRKNNGRSPASILSVFNSQLPGAVSVAATLFTAEPALSEDVLTKTFQVKSKMVDKIKERLATKK
ncbi:unnamed protein product [Brassica oleracea var. botrytis]